MDNLMPCPFCGAGPEEIHVIARENDAWVECFACHSKGAFIKYTKKDIQELCREKAVEAWNRRVNDG